MDASLGSQHFQEGSTPFFPLQSAPVIAASLIHVNLAPTASYYSEQVSTGANYSMVFKGGYHLDPNWLLKAFLDFNNTLNSAFKTFGFYVRYQFQPLPPLSSSDANKLPDWNALRLLAPQ